MNKGSSGGGIGVCGILFIVFLVLKLTDHIAWSWWWVTAPVWIPVLVGMGILGIIGGFLWRKNKKPAKKRSIYHGQ